MKAALVATFAALLSLAATSGFAQSYSGSGSASFVPGTPVVGSGYPLSHGFGSSTAFEGFARGKAEVIRAAGEFNYNTSLALINREVARSRALDNRAKYAQNFFELREANQAFRQQARIPRPNPEQLARIAHEAAPKRLAAHQLEPVRGTLQWPAVLTSDYFAGGRELIDQVLADRTSGRPANVLAVTHSAQQMQDVLKSLVAAIPPRDYIEAKRFLKSVSYEVQFAPAGSVLAAK